MTERSPGDEAREPDPWRAQLSALGAFIRTQRQLADLSLREMATVTRVSNAYLSQVERGLHQPSLKVLRAIAGGLGISAEQLLDQAGWARGERRGGSDDEAHRDGAGAGFGSSDAVGGTTEAVIRADPRLSEAQREALIGVYRSFLGDPDHRSSA